MIRPISAATAGYIRCKTKSLLVVTADGYLSYCGVQPVVRKRRGPVEVEEPGPGAKDREYDEEEDILLLVNAFLTIWRTR